MFLIRKKLISYILLLILGFSPLMGTAAMVQFDLNKVDSQSMQQNSSNTECQDCLSETMDNGCDQDMNSCSTCVSGIYSSNVYTAHNYHSIYSVSLHPIQFSFFSTPNIKPPRT